MVPAQKVTKYFTVGYAIIAKYVITLRNVILNVHVLFRRNIIQNIIYDKDVRHSLSWLKEFYYKSSPKVIQN